MGAIKSCFGGNRSTTYESRRRDKPTNEPRQDNKASVHDRWKYTCKPSLVRNLRVNVNTDDASVTLHWDPPSNARDVGITSYDVRFKLSDNSDSCSSKNINSTSIHLTRNCGLEPLVKYDFEVRARSDDEVGEYTLVEAFIDWSCQHPPCVKNRKIIHEAPDRDIYAFCSRECAVVFADQYCLFPECCKPKQRGADYCSDRHSSEAAEQDLPGVVEVNRDSQEFRDLCEKFRKNWAQEKGPCPAIESGVFLRIVHPAVSSRFHAYVEQLPKSHNKVRQYYHGTSLSCDIVEYLQMCEGHNCGVCGIIKAGLDDSKINHAAWQRFGGGFYFAPNSSKAHDYAARKTSKCYKAVFLCDVAPGKKDKRRKDAPHLQGPSKKCNSVEGKTKMKLFGLKYGNLNYKELVVYHPNAALPRYILFYV